MKNNILKYLIFIIVIAFNTNLFAQYGIVEYKSIQKIKKSLTQNDLENTLIFLNKKINKGSKMIFTIFTDHILILLKKIIMLH